jgi:hypothetical protein
MSEPVAATARPNFPVFTEIYREIFLRWRLRLQNRERVPSCERQIETTQALSPMIWKSAAFDKIAIRRIGPAEVYAYATKKVQGRTRMAWIWRTATLRKPRALSHRRAIRGTGRKRLRSTGWSPSTIRRSGIVARPRGGRCRVMSKTSSKRILNVADSSMGFCGSSASPVRPRSSSHSAASAAASARAAVRGRWPKRRRCSWMISCRASRSASACYHCRLRCAICLRPGPRS